ncbi:MAG: hypothetical protein ACK5NK_06810 [Niabella sp.]
MIPNFLKLFLTILITNISMAAFACGPMYPYGDDVRFCFFHPQAFSISSQYRPFIYTSSLYNTAWEGEPDSEGSNMGIQENAELWRVRCGNIPTVEDVIQGVYNLPISNKENTFFHYLKTHKDSLALQYLQFAKSCETFNTFYNDPWEKKTDDQRPQRNRLIQQAIAMANRVTDGDIKKRYAFIAVRLAFYNKNTALVNNLYTKYFTQVKAVNIIDYWALYFYALQQKDAAYKNYLLSLVFYNAPDKRFMCSQYINRTIPVARVLSYAKTNKDKAAVKLVYAVRNSGKALDELEQIQSLAPNSSGVDFLLLREINKLEDWILTPYYTYFESSLSENWYDDNPITYAEIKSRIDADKLYAKKLLQFIQSSNFKNKAAPELWQIAEAYTYFLLGEYTTAAEKIKTIGGTTASSKEVQYIINVIQSLNETANQKRGSAVIPKNTQQFLMDTNYRKNNKYIFAVGRELEYKNNTTDAALLYSKISNVYDEDYLNDVAYWKARNFRNTLYFDFFDDYFFYMDAWYEPEAVQQLINAIKNNQSHTSFDTWKFKNVGNQLNRLYDLLGTKFIRKNDLNNALVAFTNINDTLWSSTYYPYATYLNVNTFYTNMYNEHKTLPQDSTKYNKREIVEKLQYHIKEAENTASPQRAYHYFLVANAYLNMSQYGNSWMMRRYYWTSNAPRKTGLEDDAEYYGCLQAEQYYLQAGAVAKDKAFAALCLRMAGRCLKYRLLQQHKGNDAAVFSKNTHFKQLKEKHPAYYNELISNCMSFEKYFAKSK